MYGCAPKSIARRCFFREDPSRRGVVGVALMTALEIKNLKFRYSSQAENVLNIPQFGVSRGEKLFMHGPSGSGKTTLLSLVGGLFNPNSGSIAVLGKDIFALSSTARDHFRAQNIGFVFQVFNLLPYLTVIDNVLLPCQFGRQKTASFASEQEEARYLLAQLGLEDYLNSSVSKLSIGQQQRVAAARALIGSPGLIIADEPTSALDFDARVDFLKILFSQAKIGQSSVLFVSHDRSLAGEFDRAVGLAEINVGGKNSLKGLSS
jgi:putative ABC transport system ATP-binding protein